MEAFTFRRIWLDYCQSKHQRKINFETRNESGFVAECLGLACQFSHPISNKHNNICHWEFIPNLIPFQLFGPTKLFGLEKPPKEELSRPNDGCFVPNLRRLNCLS